MTASILIVDDTIVNLRLLANILSAEGYTIRVAKSGSIALLSIRSNPPDLILLDIMMPEMDGFEVCRQLKKDEQSREIPIIFISAISDLRSKVQAFEMGGVDYVIKPFQPEEVLARVETHLKLRRMQAELSATNQQLRESMDELEARVDELSALNLIIQTVATTTNLDMALQIVTGTIAHLFGVQLVMIARFDTEQAALTIIAQSPRVEDQPAMVGMSVSLEDAPVVHRAFEAGQPITIAGHNAEELCPSMQEFFHAQQIETMMIIPLLSRRGIIGTINLCANQPNREFSPSEMKLAETMAGQIAGAIENVHLFEEQQAANRRMQDELALAREIQYSLLPPSRPDWSHLEVVCYTTPAREVGGDFYTYYAFDEKRIALAIGDVSGKGVSAALLMASSLTQLDASLTQPFDNLSDRLVHLDRAILPYTKPRKKNCALCYVELEQLGPATFVAHIVNAGGIPPYICRRNGRVETVEVGGFALGQGLGAETGYQQVDMQLTAGDILILTSDGVVEAKNKTGRLFGFDRLRQTIAAGSNLQIDEMMSQLRTAVTHFTEGAELQDDLTIVIVQV